MQKFADALGNLPWAGQKLPGMPIDGYLPNNEQGRNKRDWAETDEQIQSPPTICFSWRRVIATLASAIRGHNCRESRRCILTKAHTRE